MSDLDVHSISLSPLSRAAKMVQPMTILNRSELEARFARIKEEEQLIHAQRNLLFGVEQDALGELSAERERLTADHFRVLYKLELARMADHFPVLSHEPFTWRDNDGLPQLVLFSLDDPLFRYEAKYTCRRWLRRSAHIHRHPRSLPLQIYKLYGDVEELLLRVAIRERHDITLSCRFSGTLPLLIRKKIQELKRETKFLMEFFIVVEPGAWDLKKETVTQRDPLLVGWYYDHLWLIDSFDVLPVEAALATLCTDIKEKEPVSDH